MQMVCKDQIMEVVIFIISKNNYLFVLKHSFVLKILSIYFEECE